MSQADNQLCSNCRFFESDGSEYEGFCRRHAPRSRSTHAFSLNAMLQAIAQILLHSEGGPSQKIMDGLVEKGAIDGMLWDEVTGHFRGDPWPKVDIREDWCGEWQPMRAEAE